jgi:hypothetical protein
VTVPFSAGTSGEELLRLTAKVMASAASPRGQKTALGTRVVKSLEQVGGACQDGMSGGRGLVVAEALVVVVVAVVIFVAVVATVKRFLAAAVVQSPHH